ncbi:MAG: alpha/beta hydrolase [Nitrosomonadales bacterium]|nr:alpha/beta hydrolase [Nitrosomonadales bacterium]
MQDLSELGVVDQVTLDDGVEMRYLKTGTGEPLLLMHTIRTQLDYFEAVIPTLAKHYTVYAVDLPGHGYSSIDTKAAYDEPYMRRHMVSFIEKLGLQNLSLVGESIGAVLALTIASQLPERVVRVIASNTYDYDKRYGDGVRRGNWFANFIIANVSIPYLGVIFAVMENKVVLSGIMAGGMRRRVMPDHLLTEFNEVGKRKGYRYVERKMFAVWRSWGGAHEHYRDIKAKVQLVYGDGDWSTQSERMLTASRLGGIPIITLPKTGHFGFVDNPQAMIDIILQS